MWIKKIELGMNVKCKISGLEGVCIGIVYFLERTGEVCIQPKSLNGKYNNSVWVNENFVICNDK